MLLFIEFVRYLIEEKIVFVQCSGFRVEVFEFGYVCLCMLGVGNENYIGSMYVGVFFIFVEIFGGVLFLISFDSVCFYFIVKEMILCFCCLVKGDICVEVCLDVECIC